MVMHPVQERMRGSVVPVVTPFRPGNPDEVDVDAFAAHVHRVLAAGNDAVLVAGTTGDPTSLTPEERERLYRVAREVIDGEEKPALLLAGVGTTTLSETLAHMRRAEAAGADAVAVIAPFFVKPRAEGLVAYYREVALATDLAVVLYNFPARTGYSLTPEIVLAIRDSAPNVIGMKETSMDFLQVSRISERLGQDFRLFTGSGNLAIAGAVVGTAGVISAASNLVPDRIASLWRLCSTGQWEKAREAHFELLELTDLLGQDSPAIIKAGMARLGWIDPGMRLPMLPASQDLTTRLVALMDRMGIGEPSAADLGAARTPGAR